ncbi:MAG: EAL domain-containing protein [Rhizobiaceae bacterium]|nr:EAL domain-containing protein [Rhizobiaceae bacterium]
MQRILLAIGGAAAFCAAVTFLLQIAVAQGVPVTEIVLFTSAATLLLGIGAAVLAYRAFSRASLVAAELERLTRSMDAAIKDVSLRGDREATKLAELSTTVSEKLASPAQRRHARHGDDDSEGEKGASHKAKQSAPAEPADPQTAAIDIALRRVIAGGAADLSVQPIIAAGRGEAGGFEAHFHVQPEEGSPVDIRRLDRLVADVDPAVYERMTVTSASEVVRRRLGDINERRPLHVAISNALLQDGMEFAAVLDIFKLHPSVARSIVLSVPVPVLEGGQHMASLELLSGLDLRFVAEDWSGTSEELDLVKKARFVAVKVPADRLLDRTKVRKGGPDGAALVDMARGAGLDLIAIDVPSEEDAVALIEMGVDLMTGNRLAAPRLLKS